ncbi:MAG: hypothetical protein IK092_06505, partial [Muribaculaceae bacterium]|nr:hypothetical protein [Muribaculaceae bacterium]
MRTLSIFLAIVTLIAFLGCRATEKATLAPVSIQHNGSFGEFSPTTLIISYDSIVGKQPLIDEINATGAQIKYDYKFIHAMAIIKPESMTLDEAIAHFRKVKGVTAVERDRIIRLTDPVKPPVLD